MKDYKGWTPTERTRSLRKTREQIAAGVIPEKGTCELCGADNNSVAYHNEDYRHPTRSLKFLCGFGRDSYLADTNASPTPRTTKRNSETETWLKTIEYDGWKTIIEQCSFDDIEHFVGAAAKDHVAIKPIKGSADWYRIMLHDGTVIGVAGLLNLKVRARIKSVFIDSKYRGFGYGYGLLIIKRRVFTLILYRIRINTMRKKHCSAMCYA